jgi:hypothetical protein
LTAPGSGEDREAASPTALLEMITSGWMSQAVHVAARLGVADHLAAGPRRSDDLARSLGAHADSLHRLLRGLTALGLCTERADGAFELTALGGYLRTGVTGSVRAYAAFWGGSLWPIWGALLHSVRTGRNPRALVSRTDGFGSLAQDPESASVFNRAMADVARLVADGVARAYDGSRLRRIVDVGGGHGDLLAAMLRANPAARGVLLDLPHAVAGARAHLEAVAVADRCEVVAGSFFESVPGGGDAYLLKSVLHDWDDERSLEILTACRRAMAGQGTLLVVERVMPDRMQASAEHRWLAASDLNMMVVLGGRERTASEFRALLDAAGFRLARIVPAALHYSVIEGVCAGPVSATRTPGP